jgi:alpha/beta superfamily hydrolase
MIGTAFVVGLRLRVDQVWLRCGDVRLYGEVRVPDAVPAPALLVCHGMDCRGSHGLRIYEWLAEEACRAGFVSLVFDFRGVGRSSGVFDYGFAEQEDVKCALDYLASRPEVVSGGVFVVGHSLGGAVSLYAVRGDARVQGLVLWSTPMNHDYNVRKFIRRKDGALGLLGFRVLSRLDRVFDVSRLYRLEVYGIDLRPRYVREKLMRLDECDAVSKLHIPLLVVIGQSDAVVGVDEAEEVFRSANGPKTLVVIQSADHVYEGKEEQLINETLDWIKSRLKAPGNQSHKLEISAESLPKGKRGFSGG